jgi:CHAT domain-containing protein
MTTLSAKDIARVRDELAQHPLRPGMDTALFNFATGRIDALREGDTARFGDLAAAVRAGYGNNGMHPEAPLGDVAAALVLLWAATYDLTDRPIDDLVLARRICKTIYTSASDPLVRARSVTTLCDVLQRTFDRVSDLDLAREGVRYVRDALTTVVNDVPDARAFLLMGLSGLLDVLSEGSGSGEELDEAIQLARDARRSVTDEEVRVVCDGALASLFLRRFRFLRRPLDVEDAVLLSRRALQATDDAHQEWANRANRLAGALIESYQMAGNEACLQEAAELLDQAGRRLPASSPLNAMVTVNRAAVRRRLGRQDRQDLDEVIGDLRSIAGTLNSGSEALVECQMALGDTLAARHEQTGSVKDLLESLECATAVSQAADALNVDRVTTSLLSAGARARRLADLVRRGQRAVFLERSASSFGAAIDHVVDVLQGPRSVYGERWLRDIFGAGTMAAEAFAQLGRKRDALAALMHGRELLRSLSDGRAAHGSVAVETSTESPVVHIAAAVSTGFAIIDNGGRLEIMWLPRLSVEELTRKANDFYASLAGCREHRQQGFNDMRSVLSWLWTSIMKPASKWLTSRAVTHVCLAPYGLLQLLPLHAACRPSSHSQGLWRYFADDVRCTYFASAARPPGAPRGDDIGAALVVGEPSTAALVSHLPGANYEAETIARLAGGTVIDPEEATEANLLAALGRAAYFHFAGHGEATAPLRADSPISGRKGCLILSGNDRLWDVDVARQRLASMLLVTLSACETGRVDATMPDEGLSLGNAFLEAGAHAVISSLWSVPDDSTSALMSSFANHWFVDGLGAADALHEAQVEIRRSHVGTLIQSARDFAMERDQANLEDEGSQLFEHPYFWAAFILHGAPNARWQLASDN